MQHRTRRWGVSIALAAVTVSSACSTGTPTSPGSGETEYGSQAARSADERPNVLLLTADDATMDDLRFMPRTRALIADRGTTMTNMVAPTPICVPARASMLTGQYAHNHGARTASGPRGGYASFEDAETLPVWLQRAGYTTSFVGKYLNGYERAPGAPVPPGWDTWRGLSGGTYDYAKHTVSFDGEPRTIRRYSTDLLSDLTVDLLEEQTSAADPWFTWVNYVAPHHGRPTARALRGSRVKAPAPAPRHRGTFAGRRPAATPDLFTTSTPRPWFAKPAWSRQDRRKARLGWQRRVESLQAVDEAVHRAVVALRRAGELRRTVVMFVSDNGFLTGRHNVYGKLRPHQDILRVPALVRGPGVPGRGRRNAAALALPDLAVTIAAMARATPGRVVDGLDFRRALRRPHRQRVIPIEGWLVRDGNRTFYHGVRVDDLTYVRDERDERDLLFDRARDPYELVDRSGRRAYSTVVSRVRRVAAEMRRCEGVQCRRVLTED